MHLDAILLFLGHFPTTAPAAERAGCAQKSGWNIKPAPAQSFFLLSGLLYGGEGEAASLSLRLCGAAALEKADDSGGAVTDPDRAFELQKTKKARQAAG